MRQVVSYLMGSKRMTLKEAFAQTYTRRKVAWPNRTFMKQLIAYEKTLQDQVSDKTQDPTVGNP
ncbi:hypothetical protein T484DRAFT_1868277 [Baffinella frigidus]|nr:hypothetical protein T484DRAFT_1868277 [Cryptophyta sp. CCMP2293]